MAASYLPTDLRRFLEKTIKQARTVAEEGAEDAVRRLAVGEPAAPAWLDEAARTLRRRLRAHARSLGDPLDRDTDRQETRRLIGAAAYAHWHRMLFARFLTERGLLRHPEHGVPVSLEDCRELAAEEGLADGWVVAERYAAAMLPAVFQPDDPVLALALAPEHVQRLQSLVTGLDAAVFAADDSLGWTYQFWRAGEKDAVNKSGIKIGADELPAVTQLFTEPYMVRFLLHNTLGAWWAGKVLTGDPELARTAPDEAALREACALPGYGWEMLRFVREEEVWRPAAGTFPGWPQRAAVITVLDPCCGSGHFLTEALAILAALRQVEEGLSPEAAVAATLRDNLHGLEIDGRCVQIAAFAVALTAWRIGGWQALPLPHVAWVGAPPPLPRKDFVKLANGDADLGRALGALHDLFAQAPLLGSLIEPTGGDLADPRRIERIEGLLDQLVAKVRAAEPDRAEGAVAARGMADAAALLARRYTLQATNVPFLGRNKQIAALTDYIGRLFAAAKADLATVMVSCMTRKAAEGGTVCSVAPQNWFFLKTYKAFRHEILNDTTINVLADLGPAAFQDMNWWAARTALIIISRTVPTPLSVYIGIDADTGRNLEKKPQKLQYTSANAVGQNDQKRNPDSRISISRQYHATLLSNYAFATQGITSGDNDRHRRKVSEFGILPIGWNYLQSTVEDTRHFSGRSDVIFWGQSGSHIARPQGMAAWGRPGIVVSQMRLLPVTLGAGDKFDMNASVICAHNDGDLQAIWAFCSSKAYSIAVRSVDQSVKVTTGSLVKVPFDLRYWQNVSTEKYPNGLPEPYSDDPTQWLFHGHPAQAEMGTALHVAVVRLSGYRWPAETDTEMRLSAEARDWIARAASLPPGDNDGLLCVPAVAGERPLAERLRGFLADAFGNQWSDTLERRLIAEADERFDKKAAKDDALEAWLRERAFRQHCKLFHDRPFLWHIWDGLKDGFSVFVHYHRFDQSGLRKLTYTVLGDWLARAKAEGNDLRAEKGRVLQQALERILEGEAPYDIFVRWKSLAQQPLGWDPDLDDGVRMNIRPFVTAGILRDRPNIKWTKDRGTDVKSAPWYPLFNGERINDHHTTLAEKRAARATFQPESAATK